MPRTKGAKNKAPITEDDLKIEPLDLKNSGRAKILKNNYYDLNVIPNHPCKAMFCGASKSGKTTLWINLLIKEAYYGGYFHNIFVFSPNSFVDENFDALREYYEADEENEDVGNESRVEFFDDLDEAPGIIQKIVDAQHKIAMEEGIDKAPRVLVILDDFIDNVKLVNSKVLQLLFTQGRHDGISTWVSVQAYNACPLRCRKQLNNIIAFGSSDRNEIEALMEHKHRDLTDREFTRLFDLCTKEPYSFMHINLNLKGHENNKMYRKRFFDQIYTINKHKNDE